MTEKRRIKELIGKHNITQSEFSRRFNIPLRSVQHWCSEGSDYRSCPEYVTNLISFALENGYNADYKDNK